MPRTIPPDNLSSSKDLAKQAGLRYVTDEIPGLTRRRMGRGFVYFDANGKRINDPAVRARINTLAIPPAWTDVWICPAPHGHLQATGQDDCGRKQYLYHPKWRDVANETKFERLLQFGQLLPAIRRRVRQDMMNRRLTKDTVVATVIALLDHTAMRVGNTEYVRENGSFGITTLRDRHVKIRGGNVRFRFRGKGGKLLETGIEDRRIARIVQRCEEIPGQELFQYEDDDGEYRTIESNDVNQYLQQITQLPLTAKDFRTWKASAMVAEAIYRRLDDCPSKTEAKRIVSQAIRDTASALGNTVTTCRKYYVHPSVPNLFLEGGLASLCHGFRPRANKKWLNPADQILLHVLKQLPAGSKAAA